jgi:aspartate aminotransferase
VGWALGPQEWVKAMTNYQSQTVSQAASMSQKATLKAIEAGAPELKKSLIELKARRDLGVQHLSQIPGFRVASPDGAFYIWPSIKDLLGKSYKGKKIATSSDFSVALLEHQKVAVVPGIEFGLEGYLRLSFALKEARMLEAFTRIRQFVAELS